MTESAILVWTSESDPASAAPGDAGRLSDLNQRVVRVVGRENGWADIVFGSHGFRVREKCLRLTNPVAFDVGDTVTVGDGLATVRDIIWHFSEGVPNYYLQRGTEKLSKRYLASDLAHPQ